MKVIKEIAGSLGIIPRLLVDRDNKKQGMISRLIGENEALKEQMTAQEGATAPGMKKGGKVKKMATGGSASKRADGIAVRGKTRGKMV